MFGRFHHLFESTTGNAVEKYLTKLSGEKVERHPDGFGGADSPFALLSSHPGGGGGTAG